MLWTVALGLSDWPCTDVFVSIGMSYSHLLNELNCDLLHTDRRCVVAHETLDNGTLPEDEDISWYGHGEMGRASTQTAKPAERLGHSTLD